MKTRFKIAIALWVCCGIVAWCVGLGRQGQRLTTLDLAMLPLACALGPVSLAFCDAELPINNPFYKKE